MNKLYQDASGKLCAAKTAYMITLLTFLLKFLVAGSAFFGFTFDPMGSETIMAMAVFMAPLGAVYWGRNYTKAKQSN